jgi:hypothetical protein
VERRPIIAPVEIEADALAQFAFIDLTAPPFFEDVLITGEDSFHSEHDAAISGQRALLDE